MSLNPRVYESLKPAKPVTVVSVLNEPRHKKTCLCDVPPGKTQSGLLSYRD